MEGSMSAIDHIADREPQDPQSPAARSETLRLPVTVHRTKKQPPPWQDEWSISMDGPALLELSAELLGMGDLPPRLDQIRRLTEDVIAHGMGADEGWSAASEHGLHPATLRNHESRP